MRHHFVDVGLPSSVVPTDEYRDRLNLLTAKIQAETDPVKRDAMITEAFRIHADDIGHLPLHQQALAWGMRSNVTVVQLADNYHQFKWVTLK